ncbi:MAG: TetR/AcrR family transcriptional regulator [Pseudomonadota bacterium]
MAIAATDVSARGRPKSKTKQRQILEAAVELFLDKGFDGASMDEIAVRAGVSKQTVYSHFNNKEELFSSCIEQKCVSYELSREFFDHELPVRDMLERIAHKFSSMLLAPEVVRMKRILCATAEQSPQLSDLFFEAGPRNMVAVLSNYLDSKAADGELEVENPETAARQLLYMLHGEGHNCALMNTTDRPPEEAVYAYVDDCVDLFMRAYGPR